MKCLRCGKRIPIERVYAARSRGTRKPPIYCSTPCRNQAKSARAYKRRKAASSPRR